MNCELPMHFSFIKFTISYIYHSTAINPKFPDGVVNDPTLRPISTGLAQQIALKNSSPGKQIICKSDYFNLRYVQFKFRGF